MTYPSDTKKNRLEVAQANEYRVSLPALIARYVVLEFLTMSLM